MSEQNSHSQGNLCELSVAGLSAGYDGMTILEDINFEVAAGETICIIGRNGMGKTTLLSSLVGLTQVFQGEISFKGDKITSRPTLYRARAGIGFVPQEREVFSGLTVEDNLRVAFNGGAWTLQKSYDLFPRLYARRSNLGAQLSGGEQQMLSIARALMGDPVMLLLDEPSEGLAPVIVDEVFAGLSRLRDEKGLTILLVEQHVARALEFSQRIFAIRNGRVIFDGPSEELRNNPEKLDGLIGLGTV